MKNGALVKSIEKSLEECENSGKKAYGRLLELRVLGLLWEEGYAPIYHRHRILGIEVDLVFLSPNRDRWVLVEVKSFPSRGFEAQRLSRKQKNRHRVLLEYWSGQMEIPVEYWLAYANLERVELMALDFWM